jgi:hypothetical protein
MNKYLEQFKLMFWAGYSARQRQRESKAIKRDMEQDEELMKDGKLDR